MSLYEKIISKENIYNAIYAIDSYIVEPELLSNLDRAKLAQLKDKFAFNNSLVTVLEDCHSRLIEILNDENALFEVTVYFKLKKYDSANKRIAFRPTHSASLIDQICMVAMLMPLMFDESDGKRKLSALSKAIPHNFYGNIPTTSVDRLFARWTEKYKEYSKSIIDKAHEYNRTKEYDSVLTLDLVEFFPSVSPIKLFKLIWEKAKTQFNVSDHTTLKSIITKLLFFNIKKENLNGWKNIYYSKNGVKAIDQKFMTKGLPQGLPQSYFFGNICMIALYEQMRQNSSIKNAKYFFYVDDSVIFAQGIDRDNFNKLISELNKSLKICLHFPNTDEPVLRRDQLHFHIELNYQVAFHDDDKSYSCNIDDYIAYFNNLQNIQRPVSMGGWFNCSLDEIDDNISINKLSAYESLINKLITDTKIEVQNNRNLEARLKWLYRYKKYFIYRNRKLRIESVGNIDDAYIEDFYTRFSIKTNLLNETMIENIFQSFEEDIFKTEVDFILKRLPRNKQIAFCRNIQQFEKKIANFRQRKKVYNQYLYFHQITQNINYNSTDYNEYSSLRNAIEKCGTPLKFKTLITTNGDTDSLWKYLINTNILPEWTRFVYDNSEEFKRKILNCFYSMACNIPVNDTLSIIKNNIKSVSYYELRVIVWLRNKRFLLTDFFNFLKGLDLNNINERMSIDLDILEALGIFIQRVQDAPKVDLLIQTHRIVKSLWHNGSKFLNTYTLHNEEHAITLIQNVIRIVNAIDYINLKKNDYFLLFQACYLHDISMVIHPKISSFYESNKKSEKLISKWIKEIKIISDKINSVLINKKIKGFETRDIRKDVGHILINIYESIYNYFENSIRSNHASDSAYYIREWSKNLLSYLSKEQTEYIAQISDSHSWDTDDVYFIKSYAREELVSIKYLMIVIRLADLLDLAEDRADYYLLKQNRTQMSITSRYHWISHLITERFLLNVDYTTDGNKLSGYKIYENIHLDIFLNTDMMIAYNAKKDKCKDFNCQILQRKTFTPSGEDTRKKCLEFSFLDNTNTTCLRSNQQCPLLCVWMTDKHHWLLNEMRVLESYLNSANSDLINTTIQVRFFYENKAKLEQEFIDDVKNYLNLSLS